MTTDRRGKLYTLQELEAFRPQLRRVVLAGGVFDIVHIGHINHLKAAKDAGEVLIVQVASDMRVKHKKGPLRPIQPARERAEIIAALECVDYVIIEDVPHYDNTLLSALQPDILFFHKEALNDEIVSRVREAGFYSSITVSNTEKLHHTSSIVNKILASSTRAQL